MIYLHMIHRNKLNIKSIPTHLRLHQTPQTPV